CHTDPRLRRGRAAAARESKEKMNRLRNRLILAFLAATVIPVAATMWITTSLLDRSLGFTTTKELDQLSRSLEQTAREFYQQAREVLKDEAAAGHVVPQKYTANAKDQWPESVREFWESADAERFELSGPGGDHLNYLLRRDN